MKGGVVETIRCHYLAVGDLAVFSGRWRLIVSKADVVDLNGKKFYPVGMRDAGGDTKTYRVRAETQLRVIAAPLVPPEAEARYLLTSGGA